jgi:hypothetical protein
MACGGGCGVNISFCWVYLQKLENKGVRGSFQFFSFRGIGCESDSGMIVRLGDGNYLQKAKGWVPGHGGEI